MTTTFTREKTLQDEIAPAVERGLPGVEVLAVELLSPSRFCVYVDHPEGVDHRVDEHKQRGRHQQRKLHAAEKCPAGCAFERCRFGK